MHYVLLATHTPDLCPTSNATTRQLLQDIGPTIPKIAEQTGVTIVSGPFVNREHITVAIVEAQRVEDVDTFLMEARLPQWNSIRVLPSQSMLEGMRELEAAPALF